MLLLFSCQVVSSWPHGLQHTRPLCPSLIMFETKSILVFLLKFLGRIQLVGRSASYLSINTKADWGGIFPLHPFLSFCQTPYIPHGPRCCEAGQAWWLRFRARILGSNLRSIHLASATWALCDFEQDFIFWRPQFPHLENGHHAR